MKDIKVISVDDLHNMIRLFIVNGKHIIGEYDDMKEIILLMIKSGYMFNMDRDRLRDAMEDITYMMCPEDDINKDRVSRGLEYEDDSDDSDFDHDEHDDHDDHDEHDDKHYHNHQDGETCDQCEDPEVEDIGNTSEM